MGGNEGAMTTSFMKKVLNQFLSSNETERVEAKARLEQTDFVTFASALMDTTPVLQSDLELLGLAWVLLRSKLRQIDPRTIPTVLPLVQSVVAPKVLLSFQESIASKNQVSSLLTRQMSAISALADFLLTHSSEWPELWEMLSLCLEDSRELRSVIACQLISHLCEYNSIMILFTREANNLVQILTKKMQDSSQSELCVAAFNAATALIKSGVVISKGTEALSKLIATPALNQDPAAFTGFISALKPLNATMVAVIEKVLCEAASDMNHLQQAKNALESTATICEKCPLFWNDPPVSAQLLKIVHALVVNSSTQLDLRRSATLILLQLYLGFGNFQLFSQLKDFETSILESIQIVIEECTEFEESDEEWLAQQEEELDEEQNISAVHSHQFINHFVECLYQVTASSTFTMDFTKRLVSQALSYVAQHETRPKFAVSALQILEALLADSAWEEDENDFELLIFDALSGVLQNPSCHQRVLIKTLGVLCNMSEFSYTQYLKSEAKFQTLLVNLLTIFSHLPRGKRVVMRRVMLALEIFFCHVDSTQHPSLFEEQTLHHLLQTVVTPSLSGQSQVDLRIAGFSLATAITHAAGVQFAPFYPDCISAVFKELDQLRAIPLAQLTQQDLRLLEAVIALGADACEAVTWERCQNDLPLLIEKHLDFLDWLKTYDHQSEPSILDLILQKLGTLVEVCQSSYQPYFARTLDFLVQITSRSDEIGCSSEMLSLESLVKLAAGDVNCTKTDQGHLQISLKTDSQEDSGVFEFKTQVACDKLSALNLLKKMITVFKAEWLLHFEKIQTLLRHELCSSFSFVRNAAMEIAVASLRAFLPQDSDTDRSQCAYSQGVVSPDQISALVQSYCAQFITALHRTPTLSSKQSSISYTRNIISMAYEAHVLKPVLVPPEFLDSVFTECGKLMVVYVAEELESLEKANQSENQAIPEQEEEEESAGEDSDSWDEAQEKLEYIECIYMSVMEITKALMTMYGKSCLTLFETHLLTPFTALLVAPEVIMPGRVAALNAMAVYIRFGKSEAAAAVIQPALLYARSNTVQSSEDIDAPRIQAACVCLGAIVLSNPSVIISHIDAVLQTLDAIFSHPRALFEERKCAGEAAFVVLMLMVFCGNIKHELEAVKFDWTQFATQMSMWFPPTSGQTPLFLNELLTLLQTTDALNGRPILTKQVIEGLTRLQQCRDFCKWVDQPDLFPSTIARLNEFRA